MNAKLFLLCFVSATAAYAGDPPSALFKSSTTVPTPLDRTAQFQNFITQKGSPSVIVIGRSDFVLNGPLVEGFRRLPHREDLTIGQKFLRLPVIRLFVPGPMPMPPESGGKYFAWRSDECTQPWTIAASLQDPVRGPGPSLSEAASFEYSAPLLQLNLKRSATP